MTTGRLTGWKLNARHARMLVYLLILLGIAGWRFLPRPWHPKLTLETSRHIIYSSATLAQTEAMARALELLYVAYSNRFSGLPGFTMEHPKLKLRLYRDRKQFRWVNPRIGWAEAFYRPDVCHAYYPEDEANPCAWMIHEATHQLNHEVLHLQLEQWLEEGVAEYFSTSRLHTNELALGSLESRNYPFWWIDDLATTDDLKENIRNGSVIPLRAIVTGDGGPDVDQFFNLYYLHWLALTHFIFEHPKHREQTLALMERGGGLEAFEELVGPVEQVQEEWHAYVRRMKSVIKRNDRGFLRTGRIPPEATNQ